MQPLARALGLTALVVAATGCELVFGLDDYARGAGGAGGAVPAAAGSGGDGGDGAGSTAGGTAATTGDPAATSTATGVDDGCGCVPEGWTLTAAYSLTGEPGAPRTCASGPLATRALRTPSVRCDCSCDAVDGLACALVCWEQENCAVAPQDFANTGVGACDPLGGTYRSCQLGLTLGGNHVTTPCEATSEPVVSFLEAFDLCGATVDGAACPGPGVCDEPPEGAVWCVRPLDPSAGDACPAGWPEPRDVVTDLAPTCSEECECLDQHACDQGNSFFLVPDGGSCFTLDTTRIDSRACKNVGDASAYTGGSRTISGGCAPTKADVPGDPGGSPTRLCCRF